MTELKTELEEKLLEKRRDEKKSLILLHKYLPDSLVRYAIAPYLAERVWEIWSEEERNNIPAIAYLSMYERGLWYEMEYPSMKMIREIKPFSDLHKIESVSNGYNKHDYIIVEYLYGDDNPNYYIYNLRLYNSISKQSYAYEIFPEDKLKKFKCAGKNKNYVIFYTQRTAIYSFDYKTGRRLWKKNIIHIKHVKFMHKDESIIFVNTFEHVGSGAYSVEIIDAKNGRTKEKIEENIHIGIMRVNPTSVMYIKQRYLNSNSKSTLVVRRIDDIKNIVSEIDFPAEMPDFSFYNDKVVIITWYPHHRIEVWDAIKRNRLFTHELCVEPEYWYLHITFVRTGLLVQVGPYLGIYDIQKNTIEFERIFDERIWVIYSLQDSFIIEKDSGVRFVYKHKLHLPTIN